MRVTAAITAGLLAATAALVLVAPAASAATSAAPAVSSQDCRNGGGIPRLWGWTLKCTGGIHHGRPID
ncbi:hypothetical protein ACIBQX_07230 [Nonomuraea sp. NPDC049714]|uniref:hypothetical protein n=1 Tax=Nonomuraea sp. NPDC049714 TaxID=3364357 RepID=UPI003789E79F